MKPELSKKNPYWIEKHRFYELKHFCLQFPIWKKAYDSMDGLLERPRDLAIYGKTNSIANPTERVALMKTFYSERMDLIIKTTEDTDQTMAPYLLRGVTEGLSYDTMNVQNGIPCCRDVYYELYRRFFWLLNKARD